MQFLYGFRYFKRYKYAISNINGESVLELCFGDIVIADFCFRNKIKWTGYDINQRFVNRAIKKGHNAMFCDLRTFKKITKADNCIIVGSLYHFIDIINSFMQLIFNSADRVIISEPIKNISSGNKRINRFAALLSNAGNGHETFRFSEHGLIKTLEYYSEKYNFTISKKEFYKKDIIVILDKCKTPK